MSPSRSSAIAVETPPNRGRGRRLLAAIGQPIVDRTLGAFAAIGMAAAVLSESCRPLAWRRPVKAQFLRTMVQAGLGGIRAAMISGALIGIAMVMQAAYWLQVAGQEDLTGRLLVLLLIREVAPVIMGLIIVGRSATGMIIELSLLRAGGQIRMLEAQGIDPFRFLVMPRIVAIAVSLFSLTVIFVITALVLGHLFGYALGVSQRTLFGFLDSVLLAMGPLDFVILPVKSLAIGLAIGVAGTFAVFGNRAPSQGMQDLIARGFVNAVLAVFLVSGGISLLL